MTERRIYIATRHPDTVIVYERDGTFVMTWGEGLFKNTHGITIGPDYSVYVTDNRNHVVRKLTTDGELLMTLRTPGLETDTGYDRSGTAEIHHNETVSRSAGPFNESCNTALGPNGDLYVADGYGNARVHRFSGDGQFVQSWGEPGSDPGSSTSHTASVWRATAASSWQTE